jgi:hypothetical protein
MATFSELYILLGPQVKFCPVLLTILKCTSGKTASQFESHSFFPQEKNRREQIPMITKKGGTYFSS